MVEAYLEGSGRNRIRLDRPVSLGRSSSCDVPLNDTACSRRHALINPQAGGEMWIVDLGSTNGTHVNGRRLLRPTRLSDGDRIELGRTKFVFHTTAKPAAAASASGTQTQIETQPAIRVEEAWMVLADIEGFTAFSRQQPPEEVSKRIGGWLSACSTRFADHGADIQIFLGDGFFAYLPVRTFPTETFFGVLDGLTAIQSDPKHLTFRLIVHYDPITLGGITAGGVESALGPGVNYLFRMEKIAAAARIRLAATTSAIIRWPDPKPPHRSTGPHALKGFDGKYELFALE